MIPMSGWDMWPSLIYSKMCKAGNPAQLLERLPCMRKTLALVPSPHIPGLVHTCNPGTLEMKAGEPRVQGHLQFHGDTEVSLGDRRPCLKNRKERLERGRRDLLSTRSAADPALRL